MAQAKKTAKKKPTQKPAQQEADVPVRARIVRNLTESIVFLTEAKSGLFPDSIIQARGFLRAGGLEMQKRLIWISPRGDGEDATEIEEGYQTTEAWLTAVWKDYPGSVAIYIAGDAGPVAGMMVDSDNPTNWVVNLEFGEDDSVEANFFRVPPEVMNGMAAALSKKS